MALPQVQNILDAFQGVGWFALDLQYNDQSSTSGDGTTIVKSLADPVWTGHGESKLLRARDLGYWRAVLAGLDNGRQLFLGYDFTSVWPRLYPRGSWPGGPAFGGASAEIVQIGSDGRSIALTMLPANYQGSIGDMLSAIYGSGSPAPRALWRAVESFRSDVSGTTPLFEVRGAIPAALAVGDLVTVAKPSCHMILQPGSVKFPASTQWEGSFTFDAIQEPNP